MLGVINYINYKCVCEILHTLTDAVMSCIDTSTTLIKKQPKKILYMFIQN